MAAPSLTGASDVTFQENIINAYSLSIASGVTLTDPEGDFAGATLTVSGLLPEDMVGIPFGVTVYLSGGTVYYDADGAGGAAGIAIGTAGGGAGSTFKVTFNANATTAAVQAAIQSLVYRNVSDTPTMARKLTIALSDQANPAGVPVWGAPVEVKSISADSVPIKSAFFDLNADGIPDMVRGGAGGVFYTNLGNGDGTFSAANFAYGFTGSNLAPAGFDYDNDGDLDVVVGGADGKLRLFSNDAAGHYVEITSGHSLLDIDVGIFSVPAFGDIDGDGDIDLVVGGGSGSGAAIYKNDGSGGFTLGFTVPFSDSRVSPGLIDMDGDGDLDVISGRSDGRLMVGYLTGGGTGYTGSAILPDWDFGDISSVAAADADGDGDMDLLVSGSSGGVSTTYFIENTQQSVVQVKVSVVPQPEDVRPVLGDLAASVTFAENTVNATPQRLDVDVTFRDIDGVVRGWENGAVLRVSGLLAEDRVSLANTTHVTFLANGQVLYDADGAGSDAPFLVGTATGGSGADFVVTFANLAYAPAIEAVIEALTYANVSNTPTASRDLKIEFTDPDTRSLFTPTFDFGGYGGDVNYIPTVRVTAGYLGGSGDEFVAGRADGTITYVNGPAIARFAGIDVGTNAAPVLIDWDYDSDDDLFVGAGDGTIHYFRCVSGVYGEVVGAGNPFNGLDFGSNASPAFGDLDGDGDLDVLISHNGGITWRLNNGGVFGGGGSIGGAWAGAAIALGDLNGDHLLDLLVGTGGEELRGYALDLSGGVLSLGAQITVPMTGGVAVNAVTFGDFNGDGFMDLGAVGGSNLWVFHNNPQWGRTITVNVTAEADEIIGTNGPDILSGTTQADIIRGLNGGDLLNGKGGNDLVDGGAGDDALIGDDGDDELQGGAGNDSLNGGLGDDLMVGGLGDDTYYTDGDDTLVETAGQGTDTVVTWINWTLGANFENLKISGGSNASGTGNALNNVITGANDGNNVLSGLGGNDTLYGQSGDDTLYGDAGNDILDGGTGEDVAYGGAGNDIYLVDDADDETIELAGGGTDIVRSSVDWGLADNIENLELTGGDSVDGAGNALNNLITGNTGANLLSGLGGNDTLGGGDGNDDLLGGAGTDVLDGGAGDDRLTGGAGKDALTGGTGVDRFIFTDDDVHSTRAGGTFELDKVLDFNRAEGDILDLSGIDANINVAGDQAFTWAAGNIFHKVAGEILIRFVTGKPTIELDVDGDGKADFKIELSGITHGLTDSGGAGGGRSGVWVAPTDGWVL